MMSRSLWPWLIACGCAGGGAVPASPPSSAVAAFVARAGDIAIVDATVVPMTPVAEVALAHHTVVVRGGRIAAVSPNERLQLPRGVTVIDGAGKWLMPGLADMHVHTWREDDLVMFLAAGVTTIRNMWGVPLHLAWRSEIERGERLGPTIVTAGGLIDGDPPDWPGSLVLAGPGGAEALVVAQKAAGYDFLKPVSRLKPEAYRALAEAGARHGMVLAGHVPEGVGLDGVLAAHQRSIEHLDGYVVALVPPGAALPATDDPGWTRAVVAARDPARLPGLIDRTLAAGAWNCATLIIYDRRAGLHGAAELAEHTPWLDKIPAATRAVWLHEIATAIPSAEDLAAERTSNAQREQILVALATANAPLLVGTDTGSAFVVPGEALHDEIELMVAAGVPRSRVLRAATADAWRYFGRPHEAGVVEVGARADLVLTASDPLTAPLPLVPEGVLVRGRWLPRAELEARLAEIAGHDAPPSAHWTAAPPLPAGGAARMYDTAISGTPIIAERLVTSGAGGTRTITGQIFDPRGDVDASYQLAAGRVTVSATYHTMKLEVSAVLGRGEVVVNGTDLAGAPVALHAPAPAGAFLSIAGVGGSQLLVDRLAGMASGAHRSFDSLELAYTEGIAITPVRYDVERRPDAAGHRVFRVTATRAGATATHELVVERDGSLGSRSDGPPVDQITTRHAP